MYGPHDVLWTDMDDWDDQIEASDYCMHGIGLDVPCEACDAELDDWDDLDAERDRIIRYGCME